MRRIMQPLAEMGASIGARENQFPPLEIQGAKLRPIDYTLPVASAQVKTCVLLAGLFAEGATSVTEPARSRDHTEIALREFGADVTVERRKITVVGRGRLTGRELVAPSDLSSAAFFMVAALLAPGRSWPSTGWAEPHALGAARFSHGMGARIRILDLESRNGELVGTCWWSIPNCAAAPSRAASPRR